ncbi:Sodium hydrogen exchanger [Musa troglodytarum]|uniref:Sodium hydrogen exchanger n=1 Tax=Musa troglodytarum TaxID=320322 RepID=A0A9E7K3W7_9LILI|nr:Sodium hydrogen exchanger [Musa troglodytarum]
MAFDLFLLAGMVFDDNAAAADRGRVVSVSMFVAVLCLCVVVGHMLEENRWTNESITAIVIGCIVGTIILVASKGKNSHIVRFDQELFFMYLVPPIIFNAGFQVKKKQFFHNFLTILLFGVVGIFISFAIISAGSWKLFPKIGFTGLSIQEYLALGAIFSTTDTVCTLQVLHQDETPRLYSLVFGEGVVNDATSIVLFNAIQKLDVSKLEGWAVLHVFGDFLYLFSTSTILGIAIGLLTSYALRALYFGRHSTDREIALMVLMAYLSYMMAELSQLSGILTVFFCGIVMSHYAWHNVTENSRITTRHIFATMSFIAETFIFLYVGMDALDIEKWKAMKTRGAVSVALAFSQFAHSGVTWDPVYATMITSTIVVVLFSTLVFGILTKPLINVVLPHHVHRGSDQQPKADDITLSLIPPEDSAESGLLQARRSLSRLLARPVHTIHAYWRKFDDKYMRPVFGGAT